MTEHNEATALFLSMAEQHGIEPEVRALLDEIGDLRPAPRRVSLARLLSETRARKQMPLPEIHRRSLISRSQLSFYETGQQKNPGLRTMHALAVGYQIPFSAVLMAMLNDMIPLPRASKGTSDEQDD